MPFPEPHRDGEPPVTLIRSAFWVGTPRDEATFRATIEGDIVPRMRHLPGVAGVTLLWPAKLEDNPPQIHCQVLVHYRSADDLQAMLASPGRAETRGSVLALLEQFDGTLSHIDYYVA